MIDGVDVSGQVDTRCLKRNATTTGWEVALFYTGSQYYGKDLHNHAPFAELQNGIPLTPSRHYKIDPSLPYTVKLYIFIFYLSAKKCWQVAYLYINI